jgi:hypothetical protein
MIDSESTGRKIQSTLFNLKVQLELHSNISNINLNLNLNDSESTPGPRRFGGRGPGGRDTALNRD